MASLSDTAPTHWEHCVLVPSKLVWWSLCSSVGGDMWVPCLCTSTLPHYVSGLFQLWLCRLEFSGIKRILFVLLLLSSHVLDLWLDYGWIFCSTHIVKLSSIQSIQSCSRKQQLSTHRQVHQLNITCTYTWSHLYHHNHHPPMLTCASANRASAWSLACLVKKSNSSFGTSVVPRGVGAWCAIIPDCRELLDDVRLVEDDSEWSTYTEIREEELHKCKAVDSFRRLTYRQSRHDVSHSWIHARHLSGLLIRISSRDRSSFFCKNTIR